MQAQLKGLHSPDVSDLESWLPNGHDFGFLLQVMIGPAGQDSAESFDLTVCTPGWLSHHIQDRSIVSGQHKLFMEKYDSRTLVNYVERYIRRFEAPSWPDLAAKLNHLGHWEFDDYQEST